MESKEEFEIRFNKSDAPSERRRSARKAPKGIFTNVIDADAKVEDAPVVSMFNRDEARAIDFQNEEVEKKNLTYAPSLRNPYYLSVGQPLLATLFPDRISGPKYTTSAKCPRPSEGSATEPSFFVSLKLFHDMAEDRVDWVSLSCNHGPEAPMTTSAQTDREATILKEMAFGRLLDPPTTDPLGEDIENGTGQSSMSIEEKTNDSEKKKKTTYSNESGRPNNSTENNRIEKGKETKYKTISPVGDNKVVENWRIRYMPIRTKDGSLMWVMLPNWKRNARKRRGQLAKLKAAFAEIWMKATATDPETGAGYRPRYSSTDLGFHLVVVPSPTALCHRLGWDKSSMANSFKSLVNKINLETTLENTRLLVEPNAPHNSVKMGENPLGLFDTYISIKDYNTYMKSLELFKGEQIQTLLPTDAHRGHVTTLNHLSNWLDGICHPMNEKEYTEPQKDAVALTNPDGHSGKGIFLRGMQGSTWRIDVNFKKMSVASTKREPKYAPNIIMGMPANRLANECFKWNPVGKPNGSGHEHRMSNGLYMAEWLHLCAFSWGGLLPLPQTSGKHCIYPSSDIPENLILGTSETNSVMTRFEKAWQALVKDETDMVNGSFAAKLVATRNPTQDNGMQEVTRDAKHHTGHYYREVSAITNEERTLTEAFHFITYKVAYSIQFPKGCRLLKMKNGASLTTTFYPFLRPLYHRLEAELDSALYNRMKERLQKDPTNVNHLQRFDHLSINRGPYDKDGRAWGRGTSPQGGQADFGRSAFALNNLFGNYGATAHDAKGSVSRAGVSPTTMTIENDTPVHGSVPRNLKRRGLGGDRDDADNKECSLGRSAKVGDDSREGYPKHAN
ncbi:hypothetical protein FGRMN_3821 [Fusarium graminum]|nr:hypothetical protein FGRMN_3821 [Fusarium graminum]